MNARPHCRAGDVVREQVAKAYFEGTGGSGRVGGGPGHGGRFCVDMLTSSVMMAIGNVGVETSCLVVQ
jgi:hypothetical protein